ncbi:MAG: hypothetical protein L3K17_02195 [Thermoplasmata archaeon]|nr:hypothetical protein [Thermoplasmata archaeon]
MTIDLASGLNLVTLGVALVILAMGLGVIVRLVRRGGFELAFAHLVVNAKRRAIFLKALCTSLAALFGLGFAISIEVLAGASPVVVGGTEASLFAVGAVGIIVLMNDAFRVDPLTLRESWKLQESAQQAMVELSRGPAGPESPDWRSPRPTMPIDDD